MSAVTLLCVIAFGSCSDKGTPEDDPQPEITNPPEEVVTPPNINTNLSQLRVEGRYLKNQKGEIVNLHGFAQTYSPYFNQSAWNNYDVSGCLNYNKGMITNILNAGWKMDFVRMHMDPYWSTTPGSNGRYEGHEFFEEARFVKYLDEVFIPMAEFAISKDLYVVMRPPGVCPDKIAVGDDYFDFLMKVWGIVSKHTRIKDNPHIMFELANEPINILGTDGSYGSSGQGHFDNMKQFLQPIVNLIRTNTNNIVLIPGLAYQSQYAGFANNPITGTNIGYAVHAYPGWYGSDAEQPSAELGGVMGGGYEGFQRGWDAQVKPVADIAPIVVTEMDWAPAKYNASWGKSITGTAGGTGFGANFKYIADNTGNVSWLIFTECHHLAAFREVAGSEGAYTFLNDPEACPWSSFYWYKEYAEGVTQTGDLVSISINGVSGDLTLLTGANRYIIVRANYSDGTSEIVTSKAVYNSTNTANVGVDKGKITANRDGDATISVAYTCSKGVRKELSFNVVSTTFPLTNELFNPSIFETGSFDETTKTLITGQYGFGGWQYSAGVDLSSYKYLIVELGNDNDSGVSFRLFDEGYWNGCATYDFGSTRKVVVELDKMYKDVSGTQVKVSPSNIKIIGFWSMGGKPIVIGNISLTNSL